MKIVCRKHSQSEDAFFCFFFFSFFLVVNGVVFVIVFEKNFHVSKIEMLKGEVLVDNNIKILCDQVSRFWNNLTKLMEWNEKRSNQYFVVKKVEWEKNYTKVEQYKNDDETSGIPHEIMNNNLEDKVINICKYAGIEIGHIYIEGCHRLPLIETTLAAPNVL